MKHRIFALYIHYNLFHVLKKLLFLLAFLSFGLDLSGQILHLHIAGKNIFQNKTIDSIGYNKTHPDAKSILDEANLLSEKLMQSGFLENEILGQKKANDTTFVFQFDLGKKTNFIHIYIGGDSQLKSLNLFKQKNDTLIIAFSEIDAYMKSTLNTLEKKGFALSKLKLVNFKKNKNNLEAELKLILDKKRGLNDIVIKGYEKFPEGFKINLKKKYKGQVFNQDNLKKIYTDFNKIRFIKQTKYPEILFTKDSTKVYVYLEKVKTNTFDGFIGFSNNENNKVIFNGYLDLALNNALNVGEKISLYWKSDGKDQKTLNVGLEIPYLFKTPVGIKAQINIFKQDSTYQNTKTALDLGYFLSSNSKLYLGYQATESNDIKNVNSAMLSDFKNAFITTTYEFTDYASDNFLFPEKTIFNFKLGTGNRYDINQNNKQFFGELTASHHIALNSKNAITIKTQNYYLKSNSYLINELYRFGGINSIRGFSENSLQANSFFSILSEYQYILAPTIYVNSIVDYGYFQDKISNNEGKLLGLGVGFGLITKNGLFNLAYANGSTNDQAIKLSNSIVHISIKTNF